MRHRVAAWAYRPVIHGHFAHAIRWMAIALRESDTGADIVPQPEPFLLVRVDAVTAFGDHILHPQKLAQRRVERFTAPFAQVWSFALVNRM